MDKLPFKLQLTPARIAASFLLGIVLPFITYTQMKKNMLQSGQAQSYQPGKSLYDENGIRRLKDGTEIQKVDIWDVEKWKKHVKVTEVK